MIDPDPDILHKTLRVLLGWHEKKPLPYLNELDDIRSKDLTAVIAESPSDRIYEYLFREGYIHQRRFALLPSRRHLRWLLPHAAKRLGIDGLQLYMPHGHVGRIVKALIVQARTSSWQGWVRDTVVIASRAALPMETALRGVTGEREFALSLSPGTPGAFQKLTVQVMRPDGSILGYMKLPMTEAAGERLRHEATTVRDLYAYSELRPHIPRLMFAGLLEGRYVVFQSALDGNAVPLRYAPLHESFLEKLHSCRSERRPGLRVVEETGQNWRRISGLMGNKWQELGREALRMAARELQGREVTCGIAHGDFAPWNMRMYGGDLRLFDWESASWNTPSLWDKFHFMTQTECLLKTRHGRESAADGRAKNPSLYLLYLLNSARQYWEEGARDVVIRYREEQLLRFMSINGRAA
jgi:hypothetical protein